MTNNLISDFLFVHTASMKSRCFLFIFIILVFILDFRLVRKLVFLYFTLNVCQKKIPCLNKVTLPYLTLPILSFLWKHDTFPAVYCTLLNNSYLGIYLWKNDKTNKETKQNRNGKKKERRKKRKVLSRTRPGTLTSA